MIASAGVRVDLVHLRPRALPGDTGHAVYAQNFRHDALRQKPTVVLAVLSHG